jgi:hypothetical protein
MTGVRAEVDQQQKLGLGSKMSSRLSFRPSRGDNVTVDEPVGKQRHRDFSLKTTLPWRRKISDSGLGFP